MVSNLRSATSPDHEPTTRAADKLRQRASAILGWPLEFIAHPDFCLPEDGGEPDEELCGAVDVGRGGAPKDLPSHLARLCESDLLSREQEQAMFRRMNLLKYRVEILRERLDIECPDPHLVGRLEALSAAASAIRDQLIRANMRLVISVVKKFVSPQRSFDEMLSDGIVSLMQAVDKFDYARGFRFSTYAYRAIARNAYRKMNDQHKENLLLVDTSEPMFEVEDREGVSSMDERTWETLRRNLMHMMDRLDRREQFIIRGRYALGRHRTVKTFQSLANKLGLSKERVRQLEQRAVSKLRSWSGEFQLLS